MKKGKLILAVALFTAGSIISSETVSAQGLKEEFNVVNRAVSQHKQSGVVHLNEADGAGIAWINGRTFINGTIEFDVRGKDKFQGSFLGIAFHGLNDTTYEAVYFRPFNFRTTDPVRKKHAVQYIANPMYDWPKLRADFPDQYEQGVPSAIDPDQWFHVKIIVWKEKISVYLNTKPVLELKSLAQTPGKMIGYWVGNGSGGDWKNLKIKNQ